MKLMFLLFVVIGIFFTSCSSGDVHIYSNLEDVNNNIVTKES